MIGDADEAGPGRGTLPEQPGPSQGRGRSVGARPGWPGKFAFTESPPVIKSSSRSVATIRRPNSEVTGWLQPARADPVATRPWTKTTIKGPARHRISHSDRIGLIATGTSFHGERAFARARAWVIPSVSGSRIDDACAFNIPGEGPVVQEKTAIGKPAAAGRRRGRAADLVMEPGLFS